MSEIVVPETKFAMSGDVSIAYQAFGTGTQDLVFVPGIVSNIEMLWEIPSQADFFAALARNFRVIALDKRGQGLSDPMDKLCSLLILSCLVCACSADAQTLEGPVTHVRDGDTIEVSGIPVRLRGINCEELGSPRGRQATEQMTQLVRGNSVSCTLNGERTGDRVVGWCSVDGVDLGDTLLRNGICGRCDRYDPERRYVDAQRVAGRWTGRVPGYCK